MRILAAVLGLTLLLLQYRLWISDHGTREVSRLQAAVDAQASANREQGARNRQLVAEVADLKVGLTRTAEATRARPSAGVLRSCRIATQHCGPPQAADRVSAWSCAWR